MKKALTFDQRVFLRKARKLKKLHADKHDPESAASDLDNLIESEMRKLGYGDGIDILNKIYVYR